MLVRWPSFATQEHASQGGVVFYFARFKGHKQVKVRV